MMKPTLFLFCLAFCVQSKQSDLFGFEVTDEFYNPNLRFFEGSSKYKLCRVKEEHQSFDECPGWDDDEFEAYMSDVQGKQSENCPNYSAILSEDELPPFL